MESSQVNTLHLTDGTLVNLKLIVKVSPIVDKGFGQQYTIIFSGGYSLEIFEERKYLYPDSKQILLKQLPRSEFVKKWSESI